MLQDFPEDYEDKSGMSTVSGTVTLAKNEQNLIGISIGGGAPYCPCLYIVQLYENTPALNCEKLQCGDEIVAVNGLSTKGLTKSELAKCIQDENAEVTIQYNKLICDTTKGKTLDIKLKKMKHKIIEGMEPTTADALGISRAVLCNDSLVRKLDDLSQKAKLAKGIVLRTIRSMKILQARIKGHDQMAAAFKSIAGRDSNHQSYLDLAKIHEVMRTADRELIDETKQVVSDIIVFTDTIVPDAKMTVKKYADAKFEYLSYCLKIKEMDDEESECITFNEPLYRVETGNYEYRMVLRCRQSSRAKFQKMRKDVLEKLELVDAKFQAEFPDLLKKLLDLRAEHALKIAEIENHLDIFPIEADLDQQTFEYGSLSEEDDPSALDSLAKELESFELEDTHSKEDAEDSLINFD
ncbi:Oidioi.mRNA.OKI2018_I69.chr2.g4704.t1.cds [Oikopleura dioica]|uniref:PRKCA-binding protein n=1 Tax=Oikopleura dioica TaxID=34765 RepID=A0ABN7SXT5_OIKDI|nr:Oidioi.mRNA.OKI2018_I69.chr2.g4704.t1.cds [Oikopleura dioica]